MEYDETIHGKHVAPEIIQTFAPPRTPDTLPRRSPFFGRKNEIEKAMRALNPEDRGWGVIIDGIGGIGKTSLAIEVAYICKTEGKFDAFIFVSSKYNRLEPSGIKEINASINLDELLNEAARTIGKQGITHLIGNDKQRVLLDALRGMRTLIIFDNLETLTVDDQIEIADFLRDLPVECKAIITSRRRANESAVTIRLERLDWEAAHELIENEMDRHPDVRRILAREGEKGWKQLYDETGGSPLALTWILGLIRTQGLNYQDALSLLQNGSGESDLNLFIFKQAQAHMDANEQLVLSALSFFGNSASFNALMETANLDRRKLDVVLERLCAQSLVDILESSENSERYSLHPLTKRYIRSNLKKDVGLEHELGMRFALYWINYTKQYGGVDEGYKSFDRLDLEWININTAADWLWETTNVSVNSLGDQKAAQELINFVPTIWRFLSSSGRYDESAQMDARLYEVAKRLRHSDLAGRSAFYVARNYYYRMQLQDASAWAQKCEDAWSTSKKAYNQCDLSLLKGNIALQNSQFEECERNYVEALALAATSKNDKKKATVLNAMGRLYYDCDKYRKAKKYYRDALILAQKIKDKHRQASYAGNLGRLAFERGNLEEAKKWYELALPLAREIRSLGNIAGLQYGLALVLNAEGQKDSALPLASDALIIYRQIQHINLKAVQEFVNQLEDFGKTNVS